MKFVLWLVMEREMRSVLRSSIGLGKHVFRPTGGPLELRVQPRSIQGIARWMTTDSKDEEKPKADHIPGAFVHAESIYDPNDPSTRKPAAETVQVQGEQAQDEVVAPAATVEAAKDALSERKKYLDEKYNKDELRAKVFSPKEAIEMLRDIRGPHLFETESLDVVVKLALDPRKPNNSLKTKLKLPRGHGKDKNTGSVTKKNQKHIKRHRIVAIVAPDQEEEARNAGADFVGGKDLVQDLSTKKLRLYRHDVVVATPQGVQMIRAASKVLGPRGLVPNEKLGTVGPNIAALIKELRSESLVIATDKVGNVQTTIGKLNQDITELCENFRALMICIAHNKPSGAGKGKYVNEVLLSSTQAARSIKVEKAFFEPSSPFFLLVDRPEKIAR